MLTTRSTSSRAARPFAAGSAAGVTLRIGLTVCLGIAGSLSLAATARADNGQIAAAQAKVAEYERTSAEASEVSMSAQLAATPTARYSAPESR